MKLIHTYSCEHVWRQMCPSTSQDLPFGAIPIAHHIEPIANFCRSPILAIANVLNSNIDRRSFIGLLLTTAFLGREITNNCQTVCRCPVSRSREQCYHWKNTHTLDQLRYIVGHACSSLSREQLHKLPPCSWCTKATVDCDQLLLSMSISVQGKAWLIKLNFRRMFR